ncbi:MAG: hypothetical protein ACLTXT_01770 [Ruminococcus callidus]
MQKWAAACSDCAGLVNIKLSDNLAALPYYSYIDSNSQANTKGFSRAAPV